MSIQRVEAKKETYEHTLHLINLLHHTEILRKHRQAAAETHPSGRDPGITFNPLVRRRELRMAQPHCR